MTAVLDTYQGVSKLVKEKYPIPMYGHKSVSAMKQIILLTTDEESVKTTQFILGLVKTMKESLPSGDKDIKDLKAVKTFHAITNENLAGINSVLDAINCQFKEGVQFDLDDEAITELLNNFSEIKESLIYISDYLQLVMEAQTSKMEIAEGKFKEFTLESLLAQAEVA